VSRNGGRIRWRKSMETLRSTVYLRESVIFRRRKKCVCVYIYIYIK
jgi:hypothetical protein